MNDFAHIAQKLAARYGGTVAQTQGLEIYLDYEVLFVINLDDPKANYRLLSQDDFRSLSDSTRKVCELTQESPFKQLRLIVYKDKTGSINFKLLHGMASHLVEEMDSMCRCMNSDEEIDL